MIIKEILTIEPTSLTITPTHRCTASCYECCFGCTPKISYIMEYEKIIKYIDEAMHNFPSIKVIIITGGECFLLGERLDDVIRHATSYGVVTRVVSNGFWAKTYEAAYARLKSLIEAGLVELNLSTGDNHQEFVDFNNIVNAVRAAYDLGLKTICVSVESKPNAIFNAEIIRNHVALQPLVDKGILLIIEASWMNFKKNKDDHSAKVVYMDSKRPCPYIFTGIVVNPYSQLLSCCGLTVEYNKFLKIGSLEKNSMKELYEKQFNDLYKFWLYVDGPEFIYEKLMEMRNEEKQTFPHECAYCIEIVKNEENLKVIKELLEKELPSILFRYKLRISKLKVE